VLVSGIGYEKVSHGPSSHGTKERAEDARAKKGNVQYNWDSTINELCLKEKFRYIMLYNL
jgi:hypothetical protein